MKSEPHEGANVQASFADPKIELRREFATALAQHSMAVKRLMKRGFDKWSATEAVAPIALTSRRLLICAAANAASERADPGALLQALRPELLRPPPPPRRRGNPLMSPKQGDVCHSGDRDDFEIAAFTARTERVALLGRADADDLAERLTLCDREHDDRHRCLECSGLVARGRCLVAPRRRPPGADRWLEPAPTILQWCPGFTSAHGLT